MHARKYGEHEDVQHAPSSAGFVQNNGRQVQSPIRFHAEMTNECAFRDGGQGGRHGKENPSTFLRRLLSFPPIEQAIATVAVTYEGARNIVPLQIRAFIDAIEVTSALILGRLLSIILALPLPFGAIEAFAVQGLDILERFAECIKHAFGFIRKLISGDESLRSEREYFGMLLRFEDETRKLAMGEIRATVQAFLDTQIGLFERVDDAIESFYRHWPYKVGALNGDGNEYELTEEGSSSFEKIKKTFEEVMEQKDVLTWVHGRPNPLDPVWEYLHTLSQTLTPDEATMQDFSKQIYFMRVVLRTTIEQVKQAATGPEASFMRAQLKSVRRLIHPTWLSQFAIQTVENITGYKVSCAVRKTPVTIQLETAKQSPRQTDTEPVLETVSATENPIEITVKHEILPCPQSSDSDATIVDEPNTVLEAVQEIPVENQENTDQQTLRAPESSSGASGDENPGEQSRAGRRRRKKSQN